jgi:hypothetical protein
MKNLYGEKGEARQRKGEGEWGGGVSVERQRQVAQSSSHGYTSVSSVVIFNAQLPPYTVLCRWFRFAQLAKGKKFRP